MTKKRFLIWTSRLLLFSVISMAWAQSQSAGLTPPQMPERMKAEIKSHLKYTKDRDQAERFIKTKTRMPEGLLAYATAPFHKATFEPDVIHGMSDVLQAYHLGNDWCAAAVILPVKQNRGKSTGYGREPT